MVQELFLSTVFNHALKMVLEVVIQYRFEVQLPGEHTSMPIHVISSSILGYSFGLKVHSFLRLGGTVGYDAKVQCHVRTAAPLGIGPCLAVGTCMGGVFLVRNQSSRTCRRHGKSHGKSTTNRG